MKKLLSILAILVFCGSLFASCAGKSAGGATTESFTPMAESYDTAAESAYGAYDEDGQSNLGGASLTDAPHGLKIVYTASLYIETLEFDQSRAAIQAAITQAGGYVSNEYSYGGYNYNRSRYNTRSASYTVRIPVEQYESFLDGAAAFGNVTDRSTSSQDITSAYIDTEARLESLRTQETRLLELLEQSGSLEDLLAIEDKLSEVRYQIESYTSTMNTYNDQIAYCTVDISLREVSTITVEADNFGTRLVEAVKGSLRSIWAFLQGFAIVVIYAIPYLVIGFLLFLLIRAIVRKRRAKRALMPPAADPYVAGNPPRTDAPKPEAPNKK